MNIESYNDLERQIQRYLGEIEHLNDVQRQLNESNLSIEERNREQQSITSHMNSTNEALSNLLDMQKAYNNFKDKLIEIRRYLGEIEHLKDVQKQLNESNLSIEERYREQQDITSHMKSTNETLNNLRNEIREIRKILPESLLNEIRKSIIAQEESLNKDILIDEAIDLGNNSNREVAITEEQNDVNYINEYEKLTDEFNEILGNRKIEEFGLNDFDEIEEKYNEVSEKRDRLFNIINALKDQISEEEFDDLQFLDSELKEKIPEEIEALNIAKEIRINDKEKTEKEIKDTEDKINELQKIDPNNPAIDEGKKKIEELNSDLDIILKGGKIKNKSSKDNVLDSITEIIKNKTSEVESLNQTQSQAQSTVQPRPQPQIPIQPRPQRPTQTQTQRSTQTQAQSQEPNTLDNLVKREILPKNLSTLELIDICGKLNIQISDASTVLSKEQVERLTNDHEIQVALLNQKIAKRNQRKISEYDKLIAKYESILKDKMEGKEFSDEYVTKVQTLLDKSKEERQIYINRNNLITARNHSEVLGAVSELREGNLDFKASEINEKLRSQYEKLDNLRQEEKSAKSKFKKWINNKRLEFLENKISSLRGKKGVIADKQKQIVNNNTTKYIDRMSKKINRHLTRQDRVDKSVDRINDLSDRIERNNQDRQNVAFDRQTETRLLDRIGLAFEDRFLQAQAVGLQNQRNMEDFVGRVR